MKSLRKQLFVVWLLCAIALAFLAPGLGTFLGRIHARNAAILLIFFMSGCTISLKSVGRDLSRWRVHAVVFAFVFVLAPAFFYFTSGWLEPEPLRWGAFLLGALPTTISSCVVYTLAGGGRVSAALLNAVGLNLLGLFLSPFLLGVFIGTGGGVDWAMVGRSMINLSWLALAPFVAGQVSVVFFKGFRAKVARVQTRLAQACVLIVVFTAFSAAHEEVAQAVSGMGFAVLYFVAAHLLFVALAFSVVRVVRFRPDEATALVFCATQKTLVLGIPLAYSYFDETEVALVIVPALIYHLFMLSFGGLLVAYWAKKNADARSGGE